MRMVNAPMSRLLNTFEITAGISASAIRLSLPSPTMSMSHCVNSRNRPC